MKLIVLLNLCFLSASVVQYAGDSTGEGTFFPLEKGHSWIYEARNSSFNDVGSIMVTGVARREFHGEFLSAHKIEIGRAASFRFYGSDDQGVFSRAYQRPGDPLPVKEESPHYLMKYPFEVGTSWQRRFDDRVSRSTVENMNASVTVPAGTFHNCMVIREITVPKDGKSGFPKKEVLSYYAPGVGLVRKTSRQDMLPLPPAGMKAFSIIGEKNLVSFEKGLGPTTGPR